MNVYSCVVIDDDPHCIETLKNYIGRIPELQLLASYTDPLVALKSFAGAAPIDLLLMDIEMPNISGIELAKELRQKTSKLLFTTAYTQYGFEAFGVDADAYLLKPYSFGTFAATIMKVLKDEMVLSPKKSESGHFFFVKSKSEKMKLVRMSYKDVIAIESKHNSVLMYTLSQKVLTYISLSGISTLLKQHSTFAQFHRSFIVNTEHIIEIEGNIMKMTNGLRIAVGDFYKNVFNEYLSGKILKNEIRENRKQRDDN